MTQTNLYPFKFLDAYTPEDKEIFFGRDMEIQQLYEMLFQTNLVLVYGVSGTGKTSLIQCGLANKFETYDWLPITIRRKSNLNDSLAEALEALSAEEEADELDALFEEDNLSGFAKQLKDIYAEYSRPIYLIFDQFEELYVLGKQAEQEAFVQTVKEVLQSEQPVKILFSIREEYLGFLYEFEKQVPQLLQYKLRVEAMNLEKVREVLYGIDENKNTNVTLAGDTSAKEAFSEALFHKIKGEEKGLFIQLPYLQVFLDKLYRQITQDDTFQEEATFSLAELQKIGDIGNVLRDFLEEQVIRIAQKLKLKDDIVWKILSPFATLEGTKEPLSEAMLKDKLKSPDLQQLTSTAIEEFVNARILRYSEKDELYEVAHDSLAKQIASKRSDEEIAILEIERLIANQLAFGRDLFSKRQIDIILPYQDKLSLGKEESRLIAESQKELKKQEGSKKRRTRNIQIGVGLFVLLLSVLSIWAVLQSREANRQAKLAKEQTEKVKEEKQKAEEEKQKAEEAELKADSARTKAENSEAKAKEALADFLKEKIQRNQNRISQLEKDKKIYQQSKDNLLIQDANREIQKLQRDIQKLEKQLIE